MRAFSFSGTYADAAGLERITWHVASSERAGWNGRYEIRTVIRGVSVWGSDFDGLEPDPDQPDATSVLSISPIHGELRECVLAGDLPCTVEHGDRRSNETLHFSLDLRDLASKGSSPKFLTLALELAGRRFAITDDWFEDGVQRLEAELPTNSRFASCVTCLYSDYSPYGHGLMGIRCHREAKQQYLSVRGKGDYWSVPVTEEVPETYVCQEFARRVPGTGYRG